MNKVIILGKIIDIQYKLVDVGKIYAIAFINLKLNKSENAIKIMCKNDIADNIYRKFINGMEILIEGNLQMTKKGIIVNANYVEKVFEKYGEMDKKPI